MKIEVHKECRVVTEENARDKSERFAVRIVKLYKFLCIEKNEYVLSKQILRSGTSIGANLAEAECAISRNDFISKVYIALKEESETLYWLRILIKTGYLTEAQYNSLYNDCEEIRKMLSSSTKTLRQENSSEKDQGMRSKTPHSTLHTPN